MRIYTDGACSQNGTQNGGWGFVVVDNSFDILITEHSGGKKDTTNNEMELTALFYALVYAKTTELKGDVTILTDSAYIHNALTQGWIESWKSRGWKRPRNQELAHKDIWIKIDYYISKIRETRTLTFEKVKGHSTNKWNNYADKLATNERDKLNRGEVD